MKKMLMIASVPSMIGQFNMANIQILRTLGCQVTVACNFCDRSVWTEERVEKFKIQLREMGIPYYQIDFSRNALNIRQHFKTYKQVRKLIKKKSFDFVHSHTPIAGVLARIAAHKCNARNIYTAHGFHFYKGAPLKNWLLFFPLEWICSWITEVLITINSEDYDRAKKHLHARKTEYVPGVGVDLEKFPNYFVNVDNKRKTLGIDENDIMLLSVGEISDRKNHEIVIRALAELQDFRMKYFICGKGALQEQLQSIVDKTGLQQQVFFLGFRTDISELCQAADLFVFPSKQEGLPVALMEAIACRTPVICSDIRGNDDLVIDINCMFDASNVESLVACLRDKLGLTITDTNGREVRSYLRSKLLKSIEQNYEKLLKYDLKNVQSDMLQIYRVGGVLRLLKQQTLRVSLNIERNAFVMLSVGELNSNKNHSTIIRALAGLNNKKIHYCIAGTGAMENELKILATELGVISQVHLLGFRNDIVDLLQAVDVYLLPSIREGLNVSLMEAMASGLPCICSDIRGNNDLIMEGKGGYRVERCNVDAWKRAIFVMYQDKKKGTYTEYGCENSSAIREFSVEKVKDKMTVLYKLMAEA